MAAVWMCSYTPSASLLSPSDREPISCCSRLGRQNNIFWTFSSVASTIKVADISQHPWYLHIFSLDFFLIFLPFQFPNSWLIILLTLSPLYWNDHWDFWFLTGSYLILSSWWNDGCLKSSFTSLHNNTPWPGKNSLSQFFWKKKKSFPEATMHKSSNVSLARIMSKDLSKSIPVKGYRITT